MQRPAHKITDIYLMPGEYFVGGPEHRVSTLLGSCVSITLWHAQRRIGAISHFLLSARPRAAGAAPDPRYGEDAFKLMLRDLAALGVAPSDCTAKVFGGGSMFSDGALRQDKGIGRKNGAVALQLLREHGIPLASESLYGNGHRRIIFHFGTGDVWSRQHDPAANGAALPARPAPAAAPLHLLQQA